MMQINRIDNMLKMNSLILLPKNNDVAWSELEFDTPAVDSSYVSIGVF